MIALPGTADLDPHYAHSPQAGGVASAESRANEVRVLNGKRPRKRNRRKRYLLPTVGNIPASRKWWEARRRGFADEDEVAQILSLRIVGQRGRGA